MLISHLFKENPMDKLEFLKYNFDYDKMKQQKSEYDFCDNSETFREDWGTPVDVNFLYKSSEDEDLEKYVLNNSYPETYKSGI